MGATEDQFEEIRTWLQDEGTGSPTTYIFADDQLQVFLDEEKLEDSEGRDPDDEDWEPTYNIKRAAARGWAFREAQIGEGFGTIRLGDVSITIDNAYCKRQYAYLIGVDSRHIPRRDGQ